MITKKGKPLAEQIAEKIINEIIDEDMEVGMKIPNEFVLAEQMEVSRSTVREAIKILVSRNIIEIRRGDGTYISERKGVADDPLGLLFERDKTQLAMDLLRVRMILEPEIAAMAAEHASEEDKEALLVQCKRVESLIRKRINHTEEDIKLHQMMAKSSGNMVVERLMPIINSSIAVFIDVTKGDLMEETIETHHKIINAISEGDSRTAKAAMELHLLYNKNLIEKEMKKRREE